MPAATDNSPRPITLPATLALYAAGFAVLAWPWLVGLVTIPGDAKALFFPQLSFLAHSLAEGQWPWWTPHVHSGWPQVADPQALIVSPFHLILAWLHPAPGFRAADAVTFAHLLVGGLAIILVFHDQRWHPAGALVAALAFCFGGANAAGLSQTLAVESVSWTMLALWLVLRAARSAGPVRWRRAAAAGLVAGLVALGRNTTALLGLYLLAGLVLWLWLAESGRGHRLKAALGPLAAGLGVALAVALVPLGLTALQTGSPFGGASGIAVRAPFHAAHLLTVAFADLFGASRAGAVPWGPASAPWLAAFGGEAMAQPVVQRFYAGVLVAIAVLGWGLLRGWLWARDIRFFTLALAAVAAYAWSRPADALFLAGALFAILGGYLVHRWLDDPAPQRPSTTRAQVALAAGLILSAFILAGYVGRVSEAVAPVLTAILFAASGGAVLWLARQLNPHRALMAASVMTAFVVADLAWNNRPGRASGQSPAIYDMLDPRARNETVALLKWRLASHADGTGRDRVSMAELGPLWRHAGQVHRIDQPWGDGALRRHPALFQASGVRLFATREPVEGEGPALVARTRDGVIYESVAPLPRAMLYGHWSIADFAALRRNGAWPAPDRTRTVLLEREPQGIAMADASGSVTISHYGTTLVELTTETESGGVLVLHDSWHPWWYATRNGEPVEILRANLLFRGVAVPPGRHVVRFEFRPFAGALSQLLEKTKTAWR